MEEKPAPDTDSPASARVRLRRKRERGSYDREVVNAILDEGLVSHLGFNDEHGQPFVTPTLHARHGDLVYCHGSAASRTLSTAAAGAPICLTVTLIDELVLARSAMHHSANYRSVMILGVAKLIEDDEEKRKALQAIVEHIVPGRWEQVRWPSDKELKATAVISIPITEASAKIRSGPPVDDEEDYSLDVWAGTIPLNSVAGTPVDDPRLQEGIKPPDYATQYKRPRRP